MSELELPPERVLSGAFDDTDHLEVVKIDVFDIADGETIRLAFESTNSPWRQGVWLGLEGELLVSGERAATMKIWKDSAPQEVLIECHTNTGRLHLYNIWDNGHGLSSQSWTSGMLIEEIENGRRYRCNDIGSNSHFDKVVFRLEHF